MMEDKKAALVVWSDKLTQQRNELVRALDSFFANSASAGLLKMILETLGGNMTITVEEDGAITSTPEASSVVMPDIAFVAPHGTLTDSLWAMWDVNGVIALRHTTNKTMVYINLPG